MKKNILIIAILFTIALLSGDGRYSENVHEYLMEQSYDLLKIDQEHEFPEMNDYFQQLIKGVKDEDKQDWVYQYDEDNPPDFNQFLLPEIIVQIGLLFTAGNDPFVTITHFWGADGGSSSSTFLSGDHPLYWSFYCENAMQKATQYLNGPFIPHYAFDDIHFVEANQLAHGYHFIKVYDLLDFYQTGLCKVYNTGGFIGWFHLIETEKLLLFYETIGRICHLMMDMDVPAHAHEDQHAAYPDNAHGDQYEGNLEENFGFMINPNNWYWESINTYFEKGGLLDISSETNPLLYLMYTTNQIADFFASDDVDGDSNLWNDSSVQNANSFLQSMFTELETQGFTEGHPTRIHHEMAVNECMQIRDRVFPFAMRTVATYLEYIAQEINLTANYLPVPFREVQGYVSLNGGSGNLTNVEVKFGDAPNEIIVFPNSSGFFSYTFNEDELGTYDVTYKLYSADGDYYIVPNIDVVIYGNTSPLTLPNVTLHPIPNPSYILVSTDENIPAFRNIQEGLNYIMYKQIDGTVNILPGLYTGYENSCSWNADVSHIKVHGIDQENCIIEGTFSVGGSSNENDIIENLTFRNIGVAIYNCYGLNTIRNNIFENCSDHVVISHSSIELINNKFVNNNCQTALLSSWQPQSPSLDTVIEDNIFENNTTTGPLIAIQAMDHLYIENNTFLDNSKIYELSSFGKGSVLDIKKLSDQISSGLISGNVFQNNIDENCGSDGILSIDNEDSWATFALTDNDFIGNSAVAMISNNSNQLSGFIDNSIFESNTIYGTYVIHTENLHCDYSLFFDNMTGNYTLASNGNCAFGSNIFSEIDPWLDENNKPLWNSDFKSPCIDSGSGTDPDGTPADIGAIPAVTHKYDIVELPSPEEDNNGWKWLSFPALDNVYSTINPPFDPDIAEYLLYDIMQLPIPATLDKVVAQDYVIEYDLELEEWLNDWRQFSRTEGFKFHMNDDFTLDVPGFKVADNTRITLAGNNVENWVGYWLEETQQVSDAFSDYWSGLNINFIQHQEWTAFYLGRWRIMLYGGCDEPTLSYGDMVVVKCNTTINNFKWESGIPAVKIVFVKPVYFTFEEQADYIPLYIELDSSNMPQEIGAFVNGECIGATVVEDTLTQINAYITSAPPGNIELELYYGGRSENQHISSYNCVTSSNPNTVLTQLSTKDNDDAWFIDLREDSSMVPTPTKVSLSNYPNPFNPATTISYSLPQEGKVILEIYNVKGQLVKQLIDGSQPEGYYEVVWNGKDNAGRSVASSIYYYRITACGKTLNKKMLLLK